MRLKHLAVVALALAGLAASTAWGQVEPFKKKVGDLKVGDVQKGPESGALEMPFILWGGDVATFYANGGLTTQDGTIFKKLDLNLKLKPGDDFVQQVKDYVEGKSAFLRGTLSMIGLASEVVGSDERTKPVVFLQMTWSQGDHMVARDKLKLLNELKGKKIVLQRDGPHVGMLDDILKTASLTWKDVNVVWVDDISGDKGPAETFRKDDTIDACFVISPDMQSLTGGLDKTGTGVEKTVKGARVLLSTASLNHSIADVYACRKDFFDKNKNLIEKFTAGYLKACEEIGAMKPSKDNKGDPAKYKALCKLAVDVYGKNPANKDAVANEADADGLISDCEFTGLSANYSFFKEANNSIGFKAKEKDALDLATGQGYAGKRVEFIAVDFDYDKLKKMAELKEPLVAVVTNKFIGELDLKPFYSFTISFEPDQAKFSTEKYGADFQKAVDLSKLYGNAVIEIRGHADGTNLVREIIRVGLGNGSFEDQGGGKYKVKDGGAIELKDVKKLLEAADKGSFSADEKTLYKDSSSRLGQLSKDRAEEVRKSVVGFAEGKGLKIDPSQMKFTGVGVVEPASMVLPANPTEQAKNRRVEFRISAVVK